MDGRKKLMKCLNASETRKLVGDINLIVAMNINHMYQHVYQEAHYFIRSVAAPGIYKAGPMPCHFKEGPASVPRALPNSVTPSCSAVISCPPCCIGLQPCSMNNIILYQRRHVTNDVQDDTRHTHATGMKKHADKL